MNTATKLKTTELYGPRFKAVATALQMRYLVIARLGRIVNADDADGYDTGVQARAIAVLDYVMSYPATSFGDMALRFRSSLATDTRGTATIVDNIVERWRAIEAGL